MENEQTFTIDQYRTMRESGIDPYAALEAEGEQADAASADELEEPTEPVEEETTVDEQEDPVEEPEDEEPIELPENQKTAFQKALEREKRKAREEAQKRVREQLESEYNPYKRFFEQLGMDPETAMKAIEQNKLQQEAQRLAEQNGWTDQETEWYIKQQQLEREQTEMRVSLRVYELADSPNYPGIKQMKGPIVEFIRKNPHATVEQAYYAVGGEPLLQQLRREAEQRQIAKRQQPKRTVVTDTQTMPTGPAPLTPEDLQFMRYTGMSEAEVRKLKEADFQNLEQYRKWKQKQGRK
jgi:hypothetical protein